MSKWDDFKKSIGDLADKTVNKTRELTDTAALKIKIANKEADRDTEFRTLGKLAYTKLKNLGDVDPEELTRQISECMERLDIICRELAELKKEEEERRATRRRKRKPRPQKRTPTKKRTRTRWTPRLWSPLTRQGRTPTPNTKRQSKPRSRQKTKARPSDATSPTNSKA